MKNELNTNIIGKTSRLGDAIAYIKGKRLAKTQKEIASAINVDEGNLSKAIKGSDKYLTEGFLQRLAEEYNLNYDWLLTGKGEMLHSRKPIIREVEEVPEENYMMVEFEDLEVSAGLLGGGEVETLPERKTRLVPREYRKGYYLVVRVSGHSMYDGTARSISEGEELLIRQFEDNYLNLPIRTKLFVIVTNEGVVVKQIKNIDEKNEEITCHSFNPLYDDYNVHFEDVLQIFTVEKKVSSKIIF